MTSPKAASNNTGPVPTPQPAQPGGGSSIMHVPECVHPTEASHASTVHELPSSQLPHAVQAPTPPAEKNPAAHAAQRFAPGAAKVPASHGVHDVAPALAATEPAGQTPQAAARGADAK